MSEGMLHATREYAENLIHLLHYYNDNYEHNSALFRYQLYLYVYLNQVYV